jgi:chaperonin GroES
MKQNIEPMFDLLLVKPAEIETTLSSGIIIPDNAKERPAMGEVMAVGFGRINDEGQRIPLVIKVGQKVLYKKWGGNEVKVEGENWMLIEEKDILAVITN